MTTPDREPPPLGARAEIGIQLAEAVETLRAIRHGEVDALVVADGSPGAQVFTLSSADRPYRMFVEAMGDGAATTSAAGIVLYANRRLAELVARPLTGVVGTPLMALVADAHRDALAAHLDRGEGQTVLEIDLLPDHGEPVPTRVGTWALDVDGERLTCLTFTDLTQQRRDQVERAAAHQRAVEASRMKSQFVANMSHEIRTPLNGVLGMSALLLDTALTEEQREYVDSVQISGAVLMAVVDQVLDFSKIESGMLELDPAPFDLRPMVEEVCAIVANSAQAKGLELLAWIDPELPVAGCGDRSRVRQVLLNLLTNAVKFTAVGEVCVQVSGTRAGQQWRIRMDVTDTGIGVGPAAVDRIFESFSQADGSTTRLYGGTGLGLAISKQLVAMMSGEIGVESLEGQGSTFWFTVLLDAVPENRSVRPPPAALAPTRVLTVDDNATGASLLQRQLAAWGMSGETAADAEAALDLLDRTDAAGRPYGMVVLDAGMPAETTPKVLAAIRSKPSHAQVPIVMLTSSPSDRDFAVCAEVDAIVTKPVSQSRLYDAIARVLDRREPLDRPSAEPSPASASTVALAVLDPVVPAPRSHAEPVAAKPDAGPDVLVLLVEDNEINQLMARRMLEKCGLAVDIAADGRAALEQVGTQRYQAIFMDCHMPELDGYQTTAEIRRREGTSRHVPIIAMTANTMEGDRERCLQAGMDDYLTKPVDRRNLNKAVARWIT